MFKLAQNLKRSLSNGVENWVQPRTGLAITAGPELNASLNEMLKLPLTPAQSERERVLQAVAFELCDRGILVPADVENLDDYLSKTFPLTASAVTYFGAPRARLGGSVVRNEKISLFGVGCDAGATKPGSRFGPTLLRENSINHKHRGSLYSIKTNRAIDVEKMIADYGDIQPGRLTLDECLAGIEKVVSRLPRQSLPLMIGGDHSLTLGAIRGLVARNQSSDFTFLQLDSHLDLQVWGDFENGLPKILDAPIHSNFVSHIARDYPNIEIIQAGVREFQGIAPQNVNEVNHYLSKTGSRFSDLDTMAISSQELLLNRMGDGKRVYISLDVDVFASSEIGHTGFPNATGLNLSTILNLLLGVIKNNEIIGMDIMEFGRSLDREDHRREADILNILMLKVFEAIKQK